MYSRELKKIGINHLIMYKALHLKTTPLSVVFYPTSEVKFKRGQAMWKKFGSIIALIPTYVLFVQFDHVLHETLQVFRFRYLQMLLGLQTTNANVC